MAGSTRRRVEPPQEEGAPAWMNTYGDMVTLVLTFFVLLFSFSTIDAKKWEAIVKSFAGSRYVTAVDSTNIESGNPDDYMDLQPVAEEQAQTQDEAAGGGNVDTKQEFDKLYEKIRNHIDINNLNMQLEVTKQDDIILLRIKDSAIFDSGKALIKPEAAELLNNVSDIFDQYDSSIGTIRVEGNTDNIPISTSEFKSNWDLSTARAVNVVEYLFSISDIDPTKFYVGGYGEFKPIADNSTEEGRAKNRRVDFVIESRED